ncbi:MULTISPECIES: glutaredoxin-like protein NrdH [Carnobacterium]|jgi:glutaredoxin-like protein NrdH|uniref:Glutaredoxin-like protein NrdH n=2 Tax=Carnobacterium inhibens TaxID=147709 RepID=U5S959_9LACT|nr:MULTISPECIES: glutaredoxin-like protein NrdH [Carnobacterium]AGY81814.1 glutaredoxin [Carnobacterium inhibens subsp. gilichinskyi]MBC9824974.1 glutaredoxin-like protein NrdH [Carnobacterium inhibens]MCM3512395.1 glutaredoxin-like protein NrdH [Carnobacterium inhibens]MDN5372493.1 glutaredoxin-like protein NrdH [Carnobacterium sp.]
MTQKTIIVYSKPNCMQCNFTKKYLEDKGISYEVKDIFESEEALNEVKELGFSSVPVISIEGHEAFNGFRPDLLDQLA